MSLSCLVNYIGLFNSSLPAPVSGLYINSLPGVTMEQFDKVAKPEQTTYLNVWSDVQTRAIIKLRNTIEASLKQRYKLKAITRSLDLGTKIDTTQPVSTPVSEYRGFTIELIFKNNFNIVYSNFQKLYITSLQVYLSGSISVDVPVKVFDMDSGAILDTFTISHTTATVGWNVIQVNKYYTGFRLFVGYDATYIAAPFQYINPNINNIYRTIITNFYGYGYANGFIQGGQTTNKDATNIEYNSTDYCMSGIFSLNCTFDAFICNNANTFAEPLWYQCGAELMTERLYSDRINRFTTIDKEKAKELRDYFSAEADNKLALILDGTELNCSDICLECNSPIQMINSSL